MQVLHSADLSNAATFPEIQNLIRKGGCIEIEDGFNQGELLCESVEPEMALRFLGFQITGESLGGGIEVALRRPGASYQSYSSGWQDSANPVFYHPDEIRSHMDEWAGGIQARLRFIRSEDGDSPRIKEVSFAWEVHADFQSHLVEWAISPLIAQIPIQLGRVVAVSADGLRLPADIDASQVDSSVTVLLMDNHISIEGVLTDGGAIAVQPDHQGMLTTGKPCQLIYTLRPNVEVVTGIFQLESLPIVLITEAPAENKRWIRAQDSILTDGEDQVLELETPWVENLSLLITVVSRTREDTNSISQQISQHLAQSSAVNIRSFGLTVPFQVSSPTMRQPFQGEDNLFRADLKIRLFNISQQSFAKAGWAISQVDVEPEVA
jgi:hypothetical protein